MNQEIICFHNPDEENAYLSNWFYCNFTVDGRKFFSTEQYMMFSKAKLMGDNTTAGKIMLTEDFYKIKKLGRQVKPYDDQLWRNTRESIMFKGIKANDALFYKKTYLVCTGLGTF